MQSDAVTLWFDRLKTTWLAKDIDGVRNLLSERFLYFENPFQEPLTTWEAVKAEWEAVRSQHIISLNIDPLIVKENEGMATYTFCMRDAAGENRVSHGAYYLRLDQKGKAVEFRQWWMHQ